MSLKKVAYLHYDNNDCTWIRVGKVTGRGFVVRQAEHLKKSKADNASSRFCMRYLTRSSLRLNSSSHKGYFDNLSKFVAVGLEVRNDQMNEMISNGFEDGGIFVYNENEKNKIHASNKAG